MSDEPSASEKLEELLEKHGVDENDVDGDTASEKLSNLLEKYD